MSSELTTLIEALGEDNFKKLVKRFNQQYYGTKEVNIVDGPYDGGIDLVVYLNGEKIKKSIQVTVQKTSIKKKLFEDVEKVEENVKYHNYQPKLDFYINSSISHQKKIKWAREAEVDYGIDLKIYDSSKLAEDADEFDEIKNTVFEIFDNIRSDNPTKISKETKVLFDMLSIGRETGEIKKEFIRSFIFLFLYENPDSTAHEVYQNLKDKLSETYDERFYDNKLNYLKSQNLLITPKGNERFRLSDPTKEEVREILQFSRSKESLLVTQIKEYLEKYGLEDCTDKLIEHLKQLYIENYEVEVEDIITSNNSYDSSLRNSYDSLINFFRKQGIKDNEEREKISKGLLGVCRENDYLNKIGVSIMFTKLFKSNKLEAYLNKKDFKVLIDTQILLRLLCVKYKKCDYPDFQYKSVKKLSETFLRYSESLELSTTSGYLQEVGGHILEALKLERFLKISEIKKLGKSNNVFYNFYLYLVESNQIEEGTFRKFIKDITNINELPSLNNPNFVDEITYSLTPLFRYLNIDIKNIPWYESDYFDELKKEYELSLTNLDLNRSYRARENDVLTLAYLCSREDHIDYETGEPFDHFFITWDSIFYDIRQSIKRKLGDSTYAYWHIYSPPKFVDRLSVMNFEINPESITYNLIALTESNFNNNEKENFVDVISSLFNAEEISELSLAKKLVNLEKKVVFQERPEDFEIEQKTRSPLTEILLQLRSYYYKRKSEHSFDNLVKVLETDSYSDNVIDILKQNIKYYQNEGEVNNTIYNDFDSLITKFKARN